MNDRYYRAFNNEINQQTMENPPKKNPEQGASTWQILNQGAGHHKRKVKRGGIAYLAKDREGKEVFNGCYSIAEHPQQWG